MRPSWIEVDLDAIRHNVAAIAAAVEPAKFCAVVKANAYGHGDVPVAEAAIAGGASSLAVALVEEGVRLRDAGIEAPILVLSEPPPDAAPLMVERRLIPTVYRRSFADALSEAASGPLAVHVKVNTGMHRVGADSADAVALARHVEALPHLELEGLWTHFAVAEEDAEFTKSQIERFDETVAALAAAGIYVPLLHAANTAGAVAYPQARYDMVTSRARHLRPAARP